MPIDLEKKRLNNAKSYQRNKAKVNARGKAWRQANPEKMAQYHVKWARKNPEKAAASVKRWRERHPETARERHQAWRKANPHALRANLNKRKARKRNVAVNDLTAVQWRTIQAAQDHRCAYCDKRCKGRLTQDHITPLAKGGNHTLHNVIGACSACNSRKRTGPPLCPVQPLLL